RSPWPNAPPSMSGMYGSGHHAWTHRSCSGPSRPSSPSPGTDRTGRLPAHMSFKERATLAFREVESELREISRWMYDNPETAYEEYQSSRRIAGFLERNGFTVTYPAYGIETAFEATAGSSGPK